MILIGDKLLSEDIFEKQFACDISACKGACCVEGEGGAPLTEEECAILDEVFDEVKPYLSKEGLDVISSTGLFTVGTDGDLETPDGKAWYVTKSPMGHFIADKKARDGKIQWQSFHAIYTQLESRS